MVTQRDVDTGLTHVSIEELEAFAELGYVVVPRVIPHSMIDAALNAVDTLYKTAPPTQAGNHAYWPDVKPPDAFLSLLLDTPALRLIESLIGPGTLMVPRQAQVALNVPPYDHRPGGPHIDGLTPRERDGRPATFTLLAGFFLTDQSLENMGNLWVWPGTHLKCAAYFREHGPDALTTSIPYPRVALPTPRQITARAGDLLLAHYMLGHNIGGNTSAVTRKVIYFRLHKAGHQEAWRDCVQDVLHELEPLRVRLNAT